MPRPSHCVTEVNVETKEVTFTYSNGETRVKGIKDMPKKMLERFALEGIASKYSPYRPESGAVGVAEFDETEARLTEQGVAGWDKPRAPRAGRISMLTVAIADVNNISVDEAQAQLAACTEDETKALASQPAIRIAIKTLQLQALEKRVAKLTAAVEPAPEAVAA